MTDDQEKHLERFLALYQSIYREILLSETSKELFDVAMICFVNWKNIVLTLLKKEGTIAMLNEVIKELEREDEKVLFRSQK